MLNYSLIFKPKQQSKKRKLSFAGFSSRLYALVHPGSGSARELSVLQLKFALVLEHYMARAKSEGRRIELTRDLCLHQRQAASFGWLEAPAFICMGCLKPQKKRNVLGCKLCNWEVCGACREKIFGLFQTAAATGTCGQGMSQAMRDLVPAVNLKNVICWAERTDHVRPEVRKWLRIAFAPNTAIFALCTAVAARKEKRPPAIAKLPQELIRMVAHTLGARASWSL